MILQLSLTYGWGQWLDWDYQAIRLLQSDFYKDKRLYGWWKIILVEGGKGLEL